MTCYSHLKMQYIHAHTCYSSTNRTITMLHYRKRTTCTSCPSWRTPQQYIMPSGCFLSSERITASLVTLIICQYGNEVVDHDSVLTVKNEVSGSSQAGWTSWISEHQAAIWIEAMCAAFQRERTSSWLSVLRFRNMGSIYRKENLEMHYVLDTCGN